MLKHRPAFSGVYSTDVITEGAFTVVDSGTCCYHVDFIIAAYMKACERRLESFRGLRCLCQCSFRDNSAVFYNDVFEADCYRLAREVFVTDEGILMGLFRIKQVGRTCRINVHIKVPDMAAGLLDSIDFNRLCKAGSSDVVRVSVKQPSKDIIPFAVQFLEFELSPLFNRLDNITNSHYMS